MRAAGFEPEDYETDPVEVWPENWRAWQIFVSVSGQWRSAGMGGYVGLDYGPLFTLMDRHGLQGEQWHQTFEDIRHIEAAALDRMRAQQND